MSSTGHSTPDSNDTKKDKQFVCPFYGKEKRFMSITGRIHSLESFGAVDGPGVRFVVFFQGCPLRCLFCHNPDSWDTNGGMLMEADR